MHGLYTNSGRKSTVSLFIAYSWTDGPLTAMYIVAATGSDVIHADALGTHLIIVNSAKAAKEMFEKRFSLYSNRFVDDC